MRRNIQPLQVIWLLVCLLALLVGNPGFGKGSVYGMEAGREAPTNISLELKEVEDSLMFKLREVGAFFDWSFYFDGKKKIIYINNGEQTCSLSIIDSKLGASKLKQPPVIKEGRTYLALDVFAELLAEMEEKNQPELVTSLMISEKNIKVGAELEAEILIYNPADKPVNLKYRSGQLYDLFVQHQGEEIWRWSEGKMFTMALMSRNLVPEEELNYSVDVPAVFTKNNEKYILSGEIATETPLKLNEVEIITAGE